MKIGVIKEIKDKENRIALTPGGAGCLVMEGHGIYLEKDAGAGSGFSNQEFQRKGAHIVSTEEAWDCDLILKIKEPLEQEYQYFKDNILFTYLHLAGVTSSLSQALLDANTTAIAYETVEDKNGAFPLLAPMSAIAGNMSATIGAYYLAKFNGGKGIQLGRVSGDRHGKVMVLGNGIVGQHAALTADGMGTNVTVFGRDEEKFQQREKMVSKNIKFVQSTRDNITEHIAETDLVIGAVLLPGARAPILVTEDMVKKMQAGSVIVDVSIDQGGCIETSRTTTHSRPVYTKHGVIHYCVSNMPGAYPRTSTIALTNATLPYVIKIASQGLTGIQADTDFSRGVNIHKGWITYPSVAESLGLQSLYKPFANI